ncbi:ig-like domain-containing protein, partial [Nephila pilipes]
TTKAGYDVIFIISFVAILCFIIFLAFFRKLYERDQKVSDVESNEVIGLKDRGCGQMLNNCVKSKGTTTNNEYLSKFLSSEYSKITKNKNSSTIPERFSKVKMREESEEMKVLLRIDIPEIAITGGGSEFNSELFRALTRFLESEMIRTKSYRLVSTSFSSGNVSPLAERFNQMLVLLDPFCLNESLELLSLNCCTTIP